MTEESAASASVDRYFDFDSTLNVNELTVAFAEKGRINVPRLLRVSDAQKLYDNFIKELDWGLMVSAGPDMGRQYVDSQTCKAFGAMQERAIVEAAYARGGKGGSHLYDSLILSGARASEPSYIGRFFRFLNSNEFIEFARAVTGIQDIARVSAQATRYRVGHFFGFHSDVDTHGKQRASLVFNITRDWMPQWGGLLQFRGCEGEIAEAYSPRFNSMSMFLPSLEHAVSCVTPAAAEPRYSIAAALLSS
jgi:hypothetical protein